MAKKVTIKGQNKLNSLEDDWGGENNSSSTQSVYGTEVPPGNEWGMNRGEVERFLKQKLSEHENAISDTVKGVLVNGTIVEKDENGNDMEVSENFSALNNNEATTDYFFKDGEENTLSKEAQEIYDEYEQERLEWAGKDEKEDE